MGIKGRFVRVNYIPTKLYSEASSLKPINMLERINEIVLARPLLDELIIVYYATRAAHSNSYIQYKHTVKS